MEVSVLTGKCKSGTIIINGFFGLKV